MEVKVITGPSAHHLNEKITEHLKQGWEAVGSHQAVVKHVQNRYAGLQHKDSISELEYSITMKREKK
jgi:hypothetical protein